MTTDTYTATGLQPYADPCCAKTEAVAFGASLTIAQGTICGQKTSDGKFKAYDADNSDGSETARVIAQYDFTTDSDGKVTIANEKGLKHHTAPVYIAGTFATSELTGLDDDAVAQLGGSLISGDVDDGVLRFG